jgi:hypothetical protein
MPPHGLHFLHTRRQRLRDDAGERCEEHDGEDGPEREKAFHSGIIKDAGCLFTKTVK